MTTISFPQFVTQSRLVILITRMSYWYILMLRDNTYQFTEAFLLYSNNLLRVYFTTYYIDYSTIHHFTYTSKNSILKKSRNLLSWRLVDVLVTPLLRNSTELGSSIINELYITDMRCHWYYAMHCVFILCYFHVDVCRTSVLARVIDTCCNLSQWKTLKRMVVHLQTTQRTWPESYRFIINEVKYRW